MKLFQGQLFFHKSGFWMTLLLAVQPCLDALAYWTRDETATPAGYIRLGLLLMIPLIVLLRTKQKKGFLLFLLCSGAYCLLHILNSKRCGYINPVTDIRYLASVIQMPVFAFCFLLIIQSEELKESAFLGVGIAASLTLLFLIAARISQTGNVTYGEGLGYSGWVIDENRNANSANLVIYACLCMYLALRTEKRWLMIAVPIMVDMVFLTNGTKGCYFSVFVIFLSYTLFFLVAKILTKKKLNHTAVIVLLLLVCFSAAVYRLTPRYQVTQAQQATARGTQGEIEATLLEQGIDISNMSPQERFNHPVVKDVFSHYYWKYLGVKPDLIDRFTMDRVLMQYQMTTDVGKLIDARVMERNYADLVFQDSDVLTKILGFEVSQMGPHGYDGSYDMENDWHAIFYYYGYLGFFLYVCFILYFVFRILLCLRKHSKNCISLENAALLLTLIMILGLAHFSGAALRRPNVSIWLSLVLALIYYVTEVYTREA